MVIKRPIEEIKAEAAAIVEKTAAGAPYDADDDGRHLFYSKEQKQLILSAAESIPLFDTEDLKRKIYDGANAWAIGQAFTNAYKKAYRAHERAAAKTETETDAEPETESETEQEPEPIEEPAPAEAETAPESLPEPEAEPTTPADAYTPDQLREIRGKIAEHTNGPQAGLYMKIAAESNGDRKTINNWLLLNGLERYIPGRHAKTATEPATDTEPQPSESEPTPAIIPPHLEDHKKHLDEHIANILDAKQRAAFHAERDAIIAATSNDLEAQADKIQTLCLKVKAAEDKQAEPPAIDPLTIRDEQAGEIIKVSATPDTPAENITGTAEAEAASEELDTHAKALKMLNLNRPIIPPHLRTAPYRDFKHALIKTEDGRTVKNPAYISEDPQDERYITNTLNNTDLARRAAAELQGEIYYDTAKDEWMIWKDTAYVHDKALFKAALIFAIETIYKEVSYLSDKGADPKALGALLKFVNNSKNSKNITSALEELKDQFNISVNFNMEASQDLISLQNIIFNTATGEIIKATDTQRINEIRKLIPYHFIKGSYDPLAIPTEYLKMVYTFYYDNTTPDLSDDERDRRAKEGAAWYLRYRGYVMFSGNPLGINLFLIGPPHNGKTTLARASGQPLKDEYDELTTISEIYASHTGPLEQYSKLAPKREILIDEGAGGEEKSQKLSGDFFKKTNTARRIRGRGIYQKDGPLAHNLKRTFTMNEAPHFDTIDGGTLRRMIIPPCLHHYTEADKIPDYDLYLLEKEGNAILSLMINECIHYIHGNPDAPEGSPERNPGLLPVPEHWNEYKANVLGGTIYTMFLINNYEPIEDPAERTKENRVYKNELISELIKYADKNGCINDLGQLSQSNESYVSQDRYGNEYTRLERTLNKAAIKQLNIALIELKFGPWANAHDTPKAYIYAKRIGDAKKTNWTF